MESINTCDIDDSHDEISFLIIKPISNYITSVADTGANINAISGTTATQYRQYIQHAPRAFRVRTGSGYIYCRQYVTITISHNDKQIPTKFYIINNLPYEYLIGRSTIRALGYALQQIKPISYHHQHESIDAINDEDVPRCSLYPTANDPNHLLNLDNVKISDRSKQLASFIRKQLQQHHQIVAKHEWDSGQIPSSQFRIEFKENVDTTPIQCNEYPHNILHIAEIERQLAYLCEKQFISKSTSSWRFPTFIVPKKSGEARIVFDYRLLNAITKRISYPLPSIQQLIDKFRGKSWISTIDIKSGYWHIPIRLEDRCKTAFVFNNQLYEWNVMPFGPTNAPAYFQKVMDDIFSDLDYVTVYMDDITIISKSPEEHQNHLKIVFQRLQEYGIKIRPDKCAFAQESVPYLGFIVDGTGSSINPKYKDKIANIPIPRTKKQLQRFLGMVNYLLKFIPNLQVDLKPFHEMTKKSSYIQWNDVLNEYFNKIKSKIMNAEMLYHPDPNKPFELYCDASGEGFGAALVQRDDNGRLQPVQFCSKIFDQTQRNWHVSEQEIYSVIYAVEKWRNYLIPRKFIVRTDHKNLEELFNRAKNFRAGKLYRWAVRLQDYEFEARWIQGKKNHMADYLS